MPNVKPLSLWFKSYSEAKVKVDNRYTDRQDIKGGGGIKITRVEKSDQIE